MPLRRKIHTFLSLGGHERALVFEAVLWLGLARLMVLAVPFPVLARWFARVPDRDAQGTALLMSVRLAITTAARNVPWNAVCLPQAMAAQAMLARRGCGSSLRLGAGFDAEGKLVAHAWLVVGSTVVVGAAGMAGVTPLARFG